MQNQKKSIKESARLSVLEHFLQSMVQLISGIEDYKSPYLLEKGKNHPNPEALVREVIKSASLKAGTISATCSLPGGAFGFITLLPELILIFRVQGNLVKDIASIYGKEAQLTKELLLFSLFKHGGAHLFRKFIEETGVKIMIRPTTVRAFQGILQKIGLDFSRRVVRNNLSRWIPFAGAALTGSFAYFDTRTVGTNAKAIFTKEIFLLTQENEPLSINEKTIEHKEEQA